MIDTFGSQFTIGGLILILLHERYSNHPLLYNPVKNYSHEQISKIIEFLKLQIFRKHKLL